MDSSLFLKNCLFNFCRYYDLSLACFHQQHGSVLLLLLHLFFSPLYLSSAGEKVSFSWSMTLQSSVWPRPPRTLTDCSPFMALGLRLAGDGVHDGVLWVHADGRVVLSVDDGGLPTRALHLDGLVGGKGGVFQGDGVEAGGVLNAVGQRSEVSFCRGGGFQVFGSGELVVGLRGHTSHTPELHYKCSNSSQTSQNQKSYLQT